MSTPPRLVIDVQRILMCLCALALLVSIAHPQEIRSGALLAADGFDRFTTPTPDIGKVETGEAAWGKNDADTDGNPIAGLVTGANGELQLRYASGKNNAPSVYLEGLTTADAVMFVTVGKSLMGSRTHTAVINYRAPEAKAVTSHSANAYHVEIAGDWSKSRDVLLRYGSQVLAVGNVADERTAQSVHRVRVAFSGFHHQVSVDEKPVIDFWETESGRNDAGYVGFGGYYSQGVWDDFELDAAITDVTEQPVGGSGRMAPLIYQGRPIFVLGTFDMPREEDLAEWKEAGGNAAIVGAFRENQSAEERRQELERLAQWGADNDAAMIYYPLINFFSKDGEQAIPTLPEELPAKKALLEELLSVTAEHPNTLGYWTFDEIENHLYKAYKDWNEKKDRGLAQWIAETMKWTYETIKDRDPDSYVMPTIAWWTTYEGLAPLYDVNVPNTYGCGPDEPHLGGKMYTIVYDAVKAADAIRASGRTSFIFMPRSYDILEGSRPASVLEQRYCFFAPITQGSMGLLPWRLGRCSMDYRRAVIYPCMREVKRLIPWLLGEWHDEKVTSNHDTATADYLKEFPERIKLLPGEEDAPMVKAEVDAVPDCSYCLRRRPDNSYLLLACSNRKEPLEITFTLKDIPGLPASARDMINWHDVPIVNGTITETFEPFAVRAYVFTVE